MSPENPSHLAEPQRSHRRPGRRRKVRHWGFRARGEGFVWLTGGALVLGVLMILGLLYLIVGHGMATFWPKDVVRMTLVDGRNVLGEVTREEDFVLDEDGLFSLPAPLVPAARKVLGDAHERALTRRMVRTGNFDLTRQHFTMVPAFAIAKEDEPEWALVVERLEWGRFYGFPKVFRIDEKDVAEEPSAVMATLEARLPEVAARRDVIRRIEKRDIGDVNRKAEAARLQLRKVELEEGKDSEAYRSLVRQVKDVEDACGREHAALEKKIAELRQENARYVLVARSVDGVEKSIPLSTIVRAYTPNRMGTSERMGLYLDRWWEFLSDEPRDVNMAGGVFPAIFGTVVMTLLMSLLVVPFGVLAALYLREYAKAGPIVSIVRVAINNLAGVPSIVFGVFGLGFFCYFVGGTIDQIFFSEKLPNPTFGTGGIFWASLTLALLTLPVVIVATEEALSAVPNSLREGSYACGASKWQTIRRIILPKALPGIMTGMILAMARGAGEVAPLMLVGAVKYTPSLAVDHVFPYIHPERSFMHLGFHVYDLGFQSPNSEAARPLVYTTTLLLVALVVILNLGALWLRARLARKYAGGKF